MLAILNLQMFYVGMQVRNLFTPIKKCVGAVRNVFRCAPESRVADVSVCDSAMESQGRAMVELAKNRVTPERTDFRSMKEMLGYAKGKVIPPLKAEKPFEYTVVANMDSNKVLAEFVGEENKCTLHGLESLLKEGENIVLIHGHPDSYPISRMDVSTLLDYNINQVIAIDKNGQFSLVAKRVDVPSATTKSKAYKNFNEACMGNMDAYFDMHSEKMLKEMTHDTLQNHADNLGLRYTTNYDYLRKYKIK